MELVAVRSFAGLFAHAEKSLRVSWIVYDAAFLAEELVVEREGRASFVHLLAVDVSRVLKRILKNLNLLKISYKMSISSSKASSVGVERARLISVSDKSWLVAAFAVARSVSVVLLDEVTSEAAVLDVGWISIVLN